MNASLDEAGGPAALPQPSPEAAAFELCEMASALVLADEAGAIAVLELAARAGGADAALFVSVIPGEDQCWYRSIAALDPDWSASALRQLHGGASNWLAHAARSSEPVLVRQARCEEQECLDEPGADLRPPRAIWLIPAPAPRGCDVLGLLMIAGKDEQRLDATGRMMPIYRALALGLTDWFQRRGRDELVRRCQLTDRDLDLLRRESLGEGSKRIASALNTEAKTIDCRFHRLNVRLGVANRRDAVRLCRRYGLI
jgi:DNA-binding CsgD family transcriptional regulator